MALAAASELARQGGDVHSIPIKVSTQIWKGALVAHDIVTGTLVPCSDALGFKFAGVAAESKLGTTEAAISCRVYKTGTFLMTTSGATNANSLGQVYYATDDATVALIPSGTNPLAVGKCLEVVSATVVRVRIDGYC